MTISELEKHEFEDWFIHASYDAWQEQQVYGQRAEGNNDETDNNIQITA